MELHENIVRAWSGGANYANITDEQYRKLKQIQVTRPDQHQFSLSITILSTGPIRSLTVFSNLCPSVAKLALCQPPHCLPSMYL